MPMMPTISMTRTDVTSEEIAAILRAGLGSRYHVLPGMRAARRPLAKPQPGHPDSIFVGLGSDRIFQAQLSLSRSPAGTELRVSPGGLGWEVPVNALGIVRRVRRVLAQVR